MKTRNFATVLDDSIDKSTVLSNRNKEPIRKFLKLFFWENYKRFKMMFISCEFRIVRKMRTVTNVALVIHNMIV